MVTKQFTFDYSAEEIIGKLKRESWQGHQSGSGRQGTVAVLKDPYLREMLDYAHGADVIAPAIQMLYETNQQHHSNNEDWCWMESPEDMYSCITSNIAFFWDPPGYDNQMHLDPIVLPYTGMVYLTPDADPRQGTRFYNFKNQDINQPLELVCEVPVQFGSGWIQANTYYSWHEGGNFTDSENRYSMIYTMRWRWNPNAERKRAYQKAIKRLSKR